MTCAGQRLWCGLSDDGDAAATAATAAAAARASRFLGPYSGPSVPNGAGCSVSCNSPLELPACKRLQSLVLAHHSQRTKVVEAPNLRMADRPIGAAIIVTLQPLPWLKHHVPMPCVNHKAVHCPIISSWSLTSQHCQTNGPLSAMSTAVPRPIINHQSSSTRDPTRASGLGAIDPVHK